MSLIPGIYIYIYIYDYTDFAKHSCFSTGPRTGPRPGLDWAPTGPRASHAWRAMDQIDIIQKTHKLARYQNRRCKVRDTSSEDVSPEDMSPKT